MGRTIKALLFVLLAYLSALPDWGRGEPAQAFYSSVPTAYMDDPRRAEWQQPEKVMDYLQIQPGQTIADIGAGTGYFTSLFARRVGQGGRVYAVDVDAEMLKRLGALARKDGHGQIKPVLASATPPEFEKGSLDLVFICDTYLFLENRTAYLEQLRTSLKQHGRLAIISFNRDAEFPGAPPQHRMIPRETTIHEATKAGFALEAEFHFLPYQDFLLFTKP